MKTIRLLTITLLALVLCSCKTQLAPEGPYKGDAFLYRADLIITGADALLTSFVKWEYQNRPYLKALPEVTKAADVVRVNLAKWLSSAFAVRDAYASNPTSESRSALTAALLVLQTAMNEAVKYMTNPEIVVPLAPEK